MKNIKKLIRYFIKKIKRIIEKIIGKENHDEIQRKRVIPWFAINGDKTLRLNYLLDDSSLVIDVGGYEGQWASDIFSKYCCNIIIFEPVKEFSLKIKNRFLNNKKIICYSVGLSKEDRETNISLLENSSSIFKDNSQLEKINLVNAYNFFKNNDITSIDLMKINIEGGEYDLLENLIENNYITNIKNIQIQFHNFIPEAKDRMKKIQQELNKTHHLTFQFEFVWENWEINNK